MSKPKPRRHCAMRLDDGERCQNVAEPRRRYCPEHGSKYVSADPEKRAKQIANLNTNGRNQHATPKVEPDAELVAERAARLEDQTPTRDAEGNVPPALKRVARALAAVEIEAESLAERSYLTVRQERRRELLERRIDNLSDRLGMSTTALLSLEPLRRQQEQAARRHVVPSRDPEHARRVFGILAASGQFGADAAAYAQERDPSGELAFFDPVEREALRGGQADAESVPEPVEHTPEIGKLRVLRDGIDLDEPGTAA